MSMVEKVARAMAAREGWGWEEGGQMLDCAAAGHQGTNRERLTWRNRARAAIEAMREPTDAMREIGNWSGLPHVETYTAMIDVALSENGE